MSSTNITTRPSVLVAAVLLAGSMLAGCDEPQARDNAGMPPPPQVTVAEMQAGPVALAYSYSGRVAAFREVEVRAQVGGTLLDRTYVEGDKVRAGDVLFRIDPASYQAEVARAQPQVQQAKVRLAQAERDAVRFKTLFEHNAGSEKASDDAAYAAEIAKAAVAAAQAALNTAQINLDYTTVKAPIDGIASLKVLPVGALVSADSLLARLVQIDSVYINFSFTDSELTDIQQRLKSRLGEGAPARRLAIRITGGEGQTAEGTIDFIDTDVDLKTGAVRARGIVPNSDGQLRPGQIVRVVVTGVTIDDAIVVPQAAVMQGPQGQYVYAMDGAGKAVVRPIVLGREIGDGWVVKHGLATGDRIITEGVIKVRPGAPVTAVAAVPMRSAEAVR